MMPGYRGLTWDHPRGREALRAAAAEVAAPGLSIEWDVHSLEGFESAPIAELAERYDLIVLDHPHLGEALETGALQPVDALLEDAELTRLAADSVGPSLESYRMADRLWALPLDAATQVAVRRADVLPETPDTWDDVLALSRDRRVALSVAGPHAFLTFCSIAVAFGAEPDSGASSGAESGDLVPAATGSRVFELMAELAHRAPSGTETMNPIAMLEAMAEGDRIDYCPLIYGYVNYSTPESGSALTFGDAPRQLAGGRRGSTIGGTGIAITARCTPTPELLDHLRWLLSADAQRGFIPQHAGQPSARSAWLDPEVNRASRNFYTATLDTIEDAYVRPRYSGYIRFQSEASALLRESFAERRSPGATVADLNRLHARSLPTERSRR
ncbi:extracellular solute-binding protein [Lysobacter korlensis]|uniref:Extracellular solute-binding protein n=1 Tax=Lysobacter korlensis TaxID=553636 RepID=A0ABV6RXZ0_9GAMM